MTPTPRTAAEQLMAALRSEPDLGVDLSTYADLVDAIEAEAAPLPGEHGLEISYEPGGGDVGVRVTYCPAALRADAITRVASWLHENAATRRIITCGPDSKGCREAHRQDARDIQAAAYAEQKPDPLVTYTDPAGGPDWEPREDER